MLRPALEQAKRSFTFISLVLLAGAAVPAVGAQAVEISKIALGVSWPVPQGNASQLLNRKLSYQGEAWLGEKIFSHDVTFHADAFYQPYTVKNMGDTSYNLVGGFVGLEFDGGEGTLGLTPFISGELGLVYDTLSFSGSPPTGTTSNASTSFALQLVPGVDVPIYRSLGLVAEFPITGIFLKNTLGIWNSVFSLRWKL